MQADEGPPAAAAEAAAGGSRKRARGNESDAEENSSLSADEGGARADKKSRFPFGTVGELEAFFSVSPFVVALQLSPLFHNYLHGGRGLSSKKKTRKGDRSPLPRACFFL